jgi:hypothetical protein
MQFTAAELEELKDFFREHLDNEFFFRRGAGEQRLVNKEQYIAGLSDPANSNEILKTKVMHVEAWEDQAFVEAQVWFKGRRGGRDVDGVFRNVRLFERKDGQWLWVVWFNKAIPGRTASSEIEEGDSGR